MLSPVQVFVDQRIAIDDAAERRVAHENRPHVAVDPRVEQERAEDLRAPADPDAERAGEVGDVGVALNVVRAAAVAA